MSRENEFATADQDAVVVLIVDDEASVRDLLARWLADAGFVCRTAASAEAAMQVLERESVALMTLDINLPGTTGIELLPRIKQAYIGTEVIMLTGLSDTQTAIKALSAGASGYLIKPVSSEELLFQTRRSLEHRRLVIDNRNYTIDLEHRVLRQTAEIRLAHEETIHRLVMAAALRDEETGAHIRRVGLYAELLAQGLGHSEHTCEQIRLAAPMHDVGKIGIPDAILRKPGKLTPEEYQVMKQHTLIGAEVLQGSRTPVLTMARDIALNHHERWDGCGYPHGKREDEIPETARIVSIVDVYDALTHDRVYRPALSQEVALELLEQGLGTQFDPVLLRVFMSLTSEMQRISAENPDEPEQRAWPATPLKAENANASERLIPVAS
jgi:putative two-component system response regulator